MRSAYTRQEQLTIISRVADWPKGMWLSDTSRKARLEVVDHLQKRLRGWHGTDHDRRSLLRVLAAEKFELDMLRLSEVEAAA